MTDELKPGAPNHGSYEHEDLAPKGILYFMLALIVGTLFCVVMLRGVCAFLDKREKASQPAMSPLVTNVPEDTRHVAHGYPKAAFPEPRLEEDERGQLYGIRMGEDKTLYTYGWVDEKAGTVRIPIDRAMDLLAQRGLPVRLQAHADGGKTETSGTETRKTESGTEAK
jgi:hypothetical protein